MTQIKDISELAAAVEKERKARGWSARKLSEEAGVSHSAYSAWIKGGHQPRIDTLILYMNALGISLTAKK